MAELVQRFRVKCGLLGSEAGKGRPLDLGRMSATGAKTVYFSYSDFLISVMFCSIFCFLDHKKLKAPFGVPSFKNIFLKGTCGLTATEHVL